MILKRSTKMGPLASGMFDKEFSAPVLVSDRAGRLLPLREICIALGDFRPSLNRGGPTPVDPAPSRKSSVYEGASGRPFVVWFSKEEDRLSVCVALESEVRSFR
ncbi:MAG: hypothetical protein ACO1SV_07525 [Fimbriimonas sp.]